MFRRNFFLSVLFASLFHLVLSAQFSQTGFSVFAGGYLQELSFTEDLAGPGYQYLVVSPVLGASYRFEHINFSVSYRRSFQYGGMVNREDLNQRPATGGIDFLGAFSVNEMDRFDVFYQLSGKFDFVSVGLGYFQHRLTRYTGSLSPSGGSPYKRQGLTFSLGLSFKEVSLEFVKQLALQNGGVDDFFSTYLYGVSALRSFSLKKKDGAAKVRSRKWDHFFPFVSLRFQPVKYHWVTVYPDLFNPVAFVPGLGVGYHFPKYDLSIMLSRDVWKRWVGGNSSLGNLIGYISTTNFVVKKYFAREGKEGKWSVGLGWHPIRNDNESPRMDVVGGTDPISGQVHGRSFPRYVNVLGVGYSLGYAFNESCEMEFRQIFPYLGDEPFTFWYSGIGFIYQWRR